MASKSIYYRGFSSFEFPKSGSFSLTEVELVKLDILNHIFTRKGERMMMPNYGTTIPDLAFEPLDELLVETVSDELEQVFDADPRVEVITMNVIPLPDQNILIISADLYYVELDAVDNLELNIAAGGNV